jgi:RHS repeat-associated protein
MQRLLAVIVFVCVTLVTGWIWWNKIHPKHHNRPPVAQVRGPYSGLIGTAVTFDGSLSSDPDHDTLTLTWDFGDGATGTGSTPSHTYSTAGTFAINLTANDGRGGVQTASTTATIAATPAATPTSTATPALSAIPVTTPTVTAAATPIATQTATPTVSAIPTATPTATTAAQNRPPTANPGGPYSGSAGQSIVFNGVGSMDPDHDAITFAWNFGDDKTGTGATPGHIYATAGVYTVTLTVNDGHGGANATTTKATVSVPTTGPSPPPEPASIAPPLPGTTATSLANATEFLYTGPSPIQTGVAPNTIQLKRVAVLRGKVLGRDGTPLPTVKISILSHTEFGQTLSRADGMFDLAVNGGGPLTIRYEKDGFLPAQRQLRVPWQDFAVVPDVVLISPDTKKTSIDLDAGAPVQVARGSKVTDADGTRQATILFAQATTATMTLADGTTRPLTTLNVRATEYTIADSGPKAMPAMLPPTSLYTYAAELTADEAVAAGATDVHFNRALPVYLENFLGFPVGTAVPTGYYDRQKGQWIPSDNGRVIKVLSITGTMADLDTDGDDAADDAAKLTALGITTEERSQLAQLYTAGQTLWRVPITHFSPWDCNWAGLPPKDASFPPGPKDAPSVDDPDCQPGSIIGVEDQTLGEVVPISGTPWGLYYTSGRTPGKRDAYTINIPVSGATVPASLRNMRVQVSIAGREYQAAFAPASNVNYTMTWDGMDIYGRQLQGTQNAVVEVDYDYAPQYYAASRATLLAFAQAVPTGSLVTADRAQNLFTLAKAWTEPVGTWDARASGLGGWTLEVHHAYDPFSGTLLLGDGRQRRGQTLLGLVITTVAGIHGAPGYNGDSTTANPLQATLAKLSGPFGVAVSSDGSLYIADKDNHRVRRVGPDGTITTVAGNGNPPGSSGDGGPATDAKLNGPYGVAVGPDGSLYIADTLNGRVRRVAPGPDGTIATGTITTFAGTTPGPAAGDGGPATAAKLLNPQGVAMGPDGSLYIADSGNNRVRRVGPDGIITTFAGTGINTFGGDGGPAAAAKLYEPLGVAVGPDGSVYIADSSNNRVRRVGRDGIITTIVGNNMPNFSGDGGPATVAQLFNPRGIAVGPDGSLYIADAGNHYVRRVGPDGIITTVAGIGGYTTSGFSGDGGPAANAKLSYPSGVALSPDGSLYIADYFNACVRRVGSALPGFSATDILVASEDGREEYVFDSSGRHLRTLNALTGATLLKFDYDPPDSGHLKTITEDPNGTPPHNVTTINHDAAGNPSTIVAPFGQRTTLTVDSDGYLNKITNPANESVRLVSTSDGLLKTFTDPNDNSSIFNYDSNGRLFTEQDAAGGVRTFARTDQDNGYTVNVTSPEHHTTSYKVESLPTGGQRRLTHFPDGTETEMLMGTNGSRKTTFADGTIIDLLQGPDPRFGMQVALPKSLTITTGGKTYTLTTSRTRTPTDLTSPLTALTDTVILNGRSSTSVYDVATRTTTITSAAARQAKVTTDSLGRIAQGQPTGLFATNFTYDAQGRLSIISQGTGVNQRSAKLTYKDNGYLDTLTDSFDRVLGFDYDTAGRVISERLPDTQQIGYGYDANGNVTSISPPNRASHLFSYTVVDLEEQYTPPDVGAVTNSTVYSYNLDKLLTLITRPDGQTLKFDYDMAGGCKCVRLSKLTLPTGSLSYAYDSTTGKLGSITTPDGDSLTYTYTGTLLANATWAGSVTGSVGRTYDNDFRLVSLTVNGADPVSFQYDADSLLTKAGLLILDRDPHNGLVTGTTLGSTTDSTNYNGFAQVADYTVKYGGAEVFKTVLTYDGVGRIATKAETIGGTATVFAYGYDPAGQLSEVKTNGTVTSTYTYDGNGNRLTGPGLATSPTYDDQDRLKHYGETTYSYTDNGELKTKTTGAEVTKYDYDVLGNLIQVVLPNGSTIDYIVDGRNRRIGKKVNGALVQGFLYENGLKPIVELDAANHIVSRFVYATHANVPDYLIRGGATYRVITDHLGSPRFVVDTATGIIAQRIDYNECGVVVNDTNPGFQPFGFAGGLYDRDTRLVRFGARDYDAQTGRWTTKDPIGFAAGDPNLYAYAANNPVCYFDPDGLIIQVNKAQQAALDKLKDDPNIGPMVRDLDKSTDIIVSLTRNPQLASGENLSVFTFGRPPSSGCSAKSATPSRFDVEYNENVARRDMKDVFNLSMRNPLEETLAHELGHAWAFLDEFRNTGRMLSDNDTNEEAVNWQNQVRGWNGLPPRPNH